MDGGSDQNYPKEIKKTKWLSDQALQLFEKRREAKGKTERELSAEFHGIARRDKKAFLSEQRKEIDENNRMGPEIHKKIHAVDYQRGEGSREGQIKGMGIID